MAISFAAVRVLSFGAAVSWQLWQPTVSNIFLPRLGLPDELGIQRCSRRDGSKVRREGGRFLWTQLKVWHSRAAVVLLRILQIRFQRIAAIFRSNEIERDTVEHIGSVRRRTLRAQSVAAKTTQRFIKPLTLLNGGIVRRFVRRWAGRGGRR